jgi:hypothetical protein
MVGAERRVHSGSTIFSYQVPYFYKNEAGLLYVEPQNDASYRAGRAKQLKEDWDEEEEGVVAEEEELGAGEEAAEAEVGTLFGGRTSVWSLRRSKQCHAGFEVARTLFLKSPSPDVR